MNRIESLRDEFEHARQAEDQRLRSSERVKISPWNPRTTMQWDRDRCERRVAAIKRFAETWWRARGYRVEWNDDAGPHQVPSGDVIEINETGPS